ncbi:hypothetical protein MHM95_18145 [Pseudoalteromonas sp. CnMc7-15]|uniref:hypothetical protein n=1 Tax=unclassified Pseudoalteromonas TaxID=194690 RepID=UPI001EF46FB7|nr:hypothetical protein [Pseudoalteromonas sp. CnMc7-15]MCG7568196.1 hypothetical protein [Pseudoalteromonas sp. CnMc7-15]
MARPKRNPVEVIQTKIFMHNLCDELGIELFGPELSYYFEGTRRASSKWKRFIAGEKTPSPGTINLILNKIKTQHGSTKLANNLVELWYSPLWSALFAGQLGSEYWTEFYKNMPIRFQKHVFEKDAPFGDSFKRRYPRHSEIDAIEKHCDREGFAFLIALARDASANKLGLYVHSLDVAIYRLFFAFCQHRPFRPFCIELWNYFKKYVVLPDRHTFNLRQITRWQQPDYSVPETIELDAYYLGIAQKIGLISTHQQARQFLFYFHINKTEKIIWEMEQYRNNGVGEFPHLSLLVKKLNTLRKAKERINFLSQLP